MSATRPSAVVVLAAGEGKRMRSAVPKVLHEAGGRSMLGHVLHAARDLQPGHLVVVVGHGRDHVVEHLRLIAPEALVAVQEEQHGTGHAVRVGLEALPQLDGTVVVTTGDTPLLTSTTLRALLEDHRRAAAAATVLTAELDDPYLGRVLRSGDGSVLGIVEARDASAEQLGVREVNSGIYAFDAADLTSALGRLTRDNAQGEEYLTDVLGLLRREGRVVAASLALDASEITGVNDRVQLADAGRLVYARTVRRWQLAGVTVVDPATTWIGPEVELEPDVTLLPGVHLEGRTTVASHAVIGPDTTLRHCQVAEGATVVRSHAVGASVGAEATVGPYSFLRPGTSLGPHSKVGAYVEVKGSTVGAGSKVPHLSYVGDAEIGEGTNIGAATVFVNYDGVEKHRTVVGDHVRIGSDTMLVAPLTVGDGAYTAAGSVITDDVPAGAMGVGRARQRVIEGWVERRRAGSASAEAAGRARASADTPGTGEPPDTAEFKDEQATAEGQDA